MDSLQEALGHVAGACVWALIAAGLGTLCGGVSGWIVGVVFTGTFAELRGALGLSGLSMWSIGCGLGFVGTCLRFRISGG